MGNSNAEIDGESAAPELISDLFDLEYVLLDDRRSDSEMVRKLFGLDRVDHLERSDEVPIFATYSVMDVLPAINRHHDVKPDIRLSKDRPHVSESP